jgi:hypothetical protein
LHFLCCDPKDRYHTNHDLYNYVRHSCGRWDLTVDFEPTEEVSDSIEQFDELLLVGAYIFGGLKDLNVKIVQERELWKIPTKQRTLIPANITFAGENTWGKDIRDEVPMKKQWYSRGQHLLQVQQKMRKER